MDSFSDQCLVKYGAAVWGNVLEVGLGLGRLHAVLARNLEIRRHVCVEKEASVIEFHRGCLTLSKEAEIVVGEAPAVNVPAVFDWVLLDIPDSRRPEIVAWAAGVLREKGGGVVYGS